MDIMGSAITELVQRHWVIGGIGASLLWFVAGEKSEHNIGPVWRGVGVAILLAVCGWCIAEQEWAGLVGGIAVLCIEVYWIMRSGQRETPPDTDR